MKSLARTIDVCIGVTFWLAGIAIAKGFWTTFFALFVAPYSWYLFIERALLNFGWL